MLRPLLPDDHHMCADVHAASGYSPLWTAQEYFSLLMLPSSTGWGVTRDNTVVGFLLAQWLAPSADILILAVSLAYQRQGIASQLLHALFTQPNLHEVFLEVNATNLAAIQLYKKFSFAEVSRRPAYYSSPTGKQDAIVLKREI